MKNRLNSTWGAGRRERGMNVNRHRIVVASVVAVAMAVTIAATTVLTGAHSVRLAVPQTVVSHKKLPFSIGSSILSTYLLTPLAPLTGCTVLVSNPSPARGQTDRKSVV